MWEGETVLLPLPPSWRARCMGVKDGTPVEVLLGGLEEGEEVW